MDTRDASPGALTAPSADAGSGQSPPPHGLRIAVVVATTGRPRTSRLTLDRLAGQSRRPDRVLAVAVTPADVAELGAARLPVESHFAPRGLCSQRNHALAVLKGDIDLIVFFDDDFVAADDYLDNAERLFAQHADIVGATGRVIADGANGRGISFEEAEALIAADTHLADWRMTRPKRGLYGCNMVFRAAAIGDLRFDEDLPLYGWQEDVDFSYRLGRRGGRLVACDAITGVHMGEKIGRTSGLRLGYSQIANPLYLLGKRSIPRDLAWRLMRNNVSSNLWGSLRPEPYIDRRGRLIGNLLAARDIVARRLHPRRILELG